MHYRKRRFIDLFVSTGWSQRELAHRLDMTPGAVNQIVSGDVVPAASSLKLLELTVQLNADGSAITETGAVGAPPWSERLVSELARVEAGQRDRLIEAFMGVIAAIPGKRTRANSPAKPKKAARSKRGKSRGR